MEILSDGNGGAQVAALRQRRQKLIAALAGAPALIQAGVAPPRNYPANQYDFRASSHFLYLVGLPLAGAALLLEACQGQGQGQGQGRSHLFVPPPADDDALWHGELPSMAALQAATGVDAVHPLPELAGWLARVGQPGRLPAVAEGERTAADARLIETIIDLRLCHDAAAVHELRRAVEVTVRAHAAGRRATRPGVRISAVRAAMEAEMLAADFTPAYPSIVTTRGEVLHSHDRSGVCEAGELLLADVGAESDTGWASDVTRTWPVSGRFSASQRVMYELVLQAQLAAIAAVKPGASYRRVHLTAARVLCAGLRDEGILVGEVDGLLDRGAHGLFFPHGVGHLIGLDVHDMEDLGDRAGYAPGRQRSQQFGLCYLRLDRDLQPGMCVTIEPGLYLVPAILRNEALTGPLRDALRLDKLDRFADVRGIRIEDDVLVTETGCEVLTAAIPKATSEIEQPA